MNLNNAIDFEHVAVAAKQSYSHYGKLSLTP